MWKSVRGNRNHLKNSCNMFAFLFVYCLFRIPKNLIVSACKVFLFLVFHRHRHSKVREDEQYSPRRSRSISRSPLPRNEREYKSSNVSRSPRRNCRSPEVVRVLTPIRSRSLSRSRSRSLR